jgi:hypothetical protein
MPRYNLIDDQESDNFDSYFQEPKKRESKESEIKPNTGFDVPSPLESQEEENPFEIERESDRNSEKESFEIPAAQESMPAEEEPELAAAQPPYKEGYYEDYEDTKQEKMNYKPIVIIFIIVVAIIIGYFLITKFVLKSPETSDITETATPIKTERDIQRENFLNGIYANKHTTINYISRLYDFSGSKINFSSILLYDKELIVEIFGDDRDAIAKFNMQVKNNPDFANLTLSTTATRPGSKGGIFALYTTSTIPPLSTAPVDSFILKTPAEFLSRATNQYNLSLHGQRNISSTTQGLFNVNRVECAFIGPENNCWQFITDLSADKANYRIYKLNFLPMDQKAIAKSAYKLNLILDFYL